jgi:hypothetical protein
MCPIVKKRVSILTKRGGFDIRIYLLGGPVERCTCVCDKQTNKTSCRRCRKAKRSVCAYGHVNLQAHAIWAQCTLRAHATREGGGGKEEEGGYNVLCEHTRRYTVFPPKRNTSESSVMVPSVTPLASSAAHCASASIGATMNGSPNSRSNACVSAIIPEVTLWLWWKQASER